MLAGLNRNRMNAVSGHGLEEIPKAEGGKVGRPSKGGDLIRSKRYYFKNHLKILQKRKLKRYITTVKKLADRHLYDVSKLKSELETACSFYKYHDHKTTTFNTILRAIDLGREDRYLDFVNKEAESILNSTPDSENYDQTDVEMVLFNMVSKHTTRLFQLATHWSAFIVVHYANNKFADEEDQIRLQHIKEVVQNAYITDYTHLTGEELPEIFIKGRTKSDKVIKQE